MGISEISSSRMVPPSASSNLPGALAMAPVNAPFSWPNRVASSMLSGIAAQLMAMKGPAARVDCWWMYCASTSLPVPDSPEINTVESLRATRAANSSSWRLAGSRATGPSLGTWVIRPRAWRATRSSRVLGSKGFTR
ncbi:hypothetical protein D3C80_756210 [compost metagenome]